VASGRSAAATRRYVRLSRPAVLVSRWPRAATRARTGTAPRDCRGRGGSGPPGTRWCRRAAGRRSCAPPPRCRVARPAAPGSGSPVRSPSARRPRTRAVAPAPPAPRARPPGTPRGRPRCCAVARRSPASKRPTPRPTSRPRPGRGLRVRRGRPRDREQAGEQRAHEWRPAREKSTGGASRGGLVTGQQRRGVRARKRTHTCAGTGRARPVAPSLSRPAGRCSVSRDPRMTRDRPRRRSPPRVRGEGRRGVRGRAADTRGAGRTHGASRCSAHRQWRRAGGPVPRGRCAWAGARRECVGARRQRGDRATLRRLVCLASGRPDRINNLVPSHCEPGLDGSAHRRLGS
jgi:hypothetical protein